MGLKWCEADEATDCESSMWQKGQDPARLHPPLCPMWGTCLTTTCHGAASLPPKNLLTAFDPQVRKALCRIPCHRFPILQVPCLVGTRLALDGPQPTPLPLKNSATSTFSTHLLLVLN